MDSFFNKDNHAKLNSIPRRVYVMELHQDGDLPIPDNIIKVGVSTNPTLRAETLSENWKHIGIRFTVKFESDLLSNSGDVEADIHIALSIIKAHFLDPRFKRAQLDGYTELFHDSDKTQKTIANIYESISQKYIPEGVPNW